MSELRHLLDLLDQWERADDLANEAAAVLGHPAKLSADEFDRLRALQRDASRKLAAVSDAVIEDAAGDSARE